jgi:prolipoprotein diacylglyceryltransferase
MAYPVGRVVMDFMRTDPANRILGLRVNVWTCLVTFIIGLVLLLRARARGSRGADGEQLPDPAETGPVAS